MSIEELKKLSEEFLDKAIVDLRKNGSVHQMFHLFHADGHISVILVDSTVTNNEASKIDLGRRIRRMIAEQNVVAVLLVSDTFWAEDLTPENDRLRQALGLTIEHAAAMGLCTAHEAVMVTLESPIYVRLLRQHYERDNTGQTITLLNREDEDSVGGKFGLQRSRFSGWFEPPQGASA